MFRVSVQDVLRKGKEVPKIDFYDGLPRATVFAGLTDDTSYAPLPEDWFVGVADVVGSTDHVAAGRYKTVNMVGAAVISAVMNAVQGRAFPFVFGGDGASFALPAEHADQAQTALAAVAAWALSEFDIELRVALVSIAAIRKAGYDVQVARFQVSQGADYAMFSGGGMLWAEAQMKRGNFLVPPATRGTVPDLTGLSCRWANMASKNGTILSLVVMANPAAPPTQVAAVYRHVIDIANGLDQSGHPAPRYGMGTRWPPVGATLEAHAARAGGSLKSAKRKALFESFVAWVLIRTGVKLGGFDARRYARVVAANADFRKLDDGLKMTLDCDPDTHRQLDDVLSRAAADKLVRYGIATQDEAMMTCIVPSIMTDDHLHFVDGAAGGYTKAASVMKGR